MNLTSRSGWPSGSYEVYLLGITRSLANTTGMEMPKEMKLGSARVNLEGPGVIPYGTDTPLKGMLANALVNLIKVGDNADSVRILEVKKPDNLSIIRLGRRKPPRPVGSVILPGLKT